MKEWKNGIWTHYDEDGNVLYRERSDGSIVEDVKHSPSDVVSSLVASSIVIGSVAVAGPLGLAGVLLAWCVWKREDGDES